MGSTSKLTLWTYDDEIGLEPLLDAERATAEALAATAPATLEGLAAALVHEHLLDTRDSYPALDDYWCYVLIASADTTLPRLIARTGAMRGG